MKSVGFIGTGVMGGSIVCHLLKAGYDVSVFNRTKTKAEDTIKMGAVWKETPAKVAENCDIVFTMLGYPSDVEEVYLGEHGIIDHTRSGCLLVDLTTSTPSLAKRIYEEAAKKGLKAIDAPVSGGDTGARNATLTIMCGGDEDAFNECLPVLQTFGRNILLQGAAGAGQHTKMCNQIAIAPGMLGVCEALAYAEKSGLDPDKVLESISGGAAGSWSLSNYGPRILNGDFAPGFYVKHFIKDMRIALEEARAMGLETPGLALAEKLYTELSEAGHDNLGTQSLHKWYTEM